MAPMIHYLLIIFQNRTLILAFKAEAKGMRTFLSTNAKGLITNNNEEK